MHSARFNRLLASTHKIPCKSHKPSGPPALQSTSDLNEAGWATNTQAKTKVVNTNVLNVIISRQNAETGKKQTLLQTHILNKHWPKKKLKLEKYGKAKFISKKKQRRASNLKGISPGVYEDVDENTPCGFCGFITLCAKGWLDRVPDMWNLVSWSLCWSHRQKLVNMWKMLVILQSKITWTERTHSWVE